MSVHGNLVDVVVTTEPAAEPVSRAEVKSFIGISHTSHDTLIDDLITGARRLAETYTGRAFIEQTRTAYWVNHGVKIWIPYAPIISVTTVTRKRDDESTVLLDGTDFFVQGLDKKFLRLASTSLLNQKSGFSPTDDLSFFDLEIKYKCGYGTSASDVPDTLRTTIMQMVSTWYNFRDDAEFGATISKVPQDSIWKLNSFKIWEV